MSALAGNRKWRAQVLVSPTGLMKDAVAEQVVLVTCPNEEYEFANSDFHCKACLKAGIHDEGVFAYIVADRLKDFECFEEQSMTWSILSYESVAPAAW